VIKPKSGYGSVKTTIISNKEELIAFLTDVKWQLDAPQGMEIEKFVEGPMFHVDGMELFIPLTGP
jgi:biotin carboxylase